MTLVVKVPQTSHWLQKLKSQLNAETMVWCLKTSLIPNFRPRIMSCLIPNKLNLASQLPLTKMERLFRCHNGLILSVKNSANQLGNETHEALWTSCRLQTIKLLDEMLAGWMKPDLLAKWLQTKCAVLGLHYHDEPLMLAWRCSPVMCHRLL